jgi:hypothetical protein
MKEPCLVFWYKDRELLAYSIRETFPSEQEATGELLAAESNIPPEAIRWTVENR